MALKLLLAEFGERRLSSISRHEAMQWAERVPPSRVPPTVTCMNAAVDAELIGRNPFGGLSHRSSRGRADEAPPTHEELRRLLDACRCHGDYAPQMRNLITFAAYTGMRPGELFALEWADIDTKAMRIHVRRRLYRGATDLPKERQAPRHRTTTTGTRCPAGPAPRRDAGVQGQAGRSALVADPLGLLGQGTRRCRA